MEVRDVEVFPSSISRVAIKLHLYKKEEAMDFLKAITKIQIWLSHQFTLGKTA